MSSIQEVSYMRARVGKISAAPNSSMIEDFSATIRLQCETPGAMLIFTRNNTVPYLNSYRDHGFRCETYDPRKGILLNGSGVHVITVVGMKKGCVSTKPKKLYYRLGWSRPPTHEVAPELLATSDDVIEDGRAARTPFPLMPGSGPAIEEESKRRISPHREHHGFTSMLPALLPEAFPEASRPASRSVARHEEKGNTATSLVVLHKGRINMSRPTSRATQSRPATSGSHVELSRSRATTPGAGNALMLIRAHHAKIARAKQREEDKFIPSLISDSRNSFQRPRYDPPCSLLNSADPAEDDGAAIPAEIETKPSLSRAGTPFQGTRVGTAASGSRSVRPNDQSQSPTLESGKSGRLSPPAPGIVSSQSATHSQLCWFDVKRAKVDDYATIDDDAEDRAAEKEYIAQSSQQVQRDVLRLGAVSDFASKNYCTPAESNFDAAADSKKLMYAVLAARQCCKTAIASVLGRVSYADVAAAVEKKSSVTPYDLHAVSGNSVSEIQLQRALRPLSSPESANVSVSTPLLLLYMRFIVWTARPIPEAPIGLAVQFLRDDVKLSAEPVVSKMDMLTVMDAYRRCRNAHPPAVQALQEAFHHGLKWSEANDVLFETFIEMLAGIPYLDAALVDMNNCPQHPMYHTPIRLG